MLNEKQAKEEQATRLAQKHFQIEEGITKIFQIRLRLGLESAGPEPVTLLEVNANTIPSGILPIQFGPNLASGFSLPSVIVEVTPREYEEILIGVLQLPEGWEIEREIPREVASGNE